MQKNLESNLNKMFECIYKFHLELVEWKRSLILIMYQLLIKIVVVFDDDFNEYCVFSENIPIIIFMNTNIWLHVIYRKVCKLIFRVM